MWEESGESAFVPIIVRVGIKKEKVVTSTNQLLCRSVMSSFYSCFFIALKIPLVLILLKEK